VIETILRRMPDYVNHICPQFSRTHVNFQRVPTVDTSNPFIAKDIPTADESMVVIRFADPKGIDFPYLLSMLHDSWMTRPNNTVVPGGKMGLAMQLIFTPMILRLIDLKKRAMRRGKFTPRPILRAHISPDRCTRPPRGGHGMRRSRAPHAADRSGAGPRFRDPCGRRSAGDRDRHRPRSLPVHPQTGGGHSRH
jgi:hypothetical protein